jgi:hypothetical protein
MEPVKQTDLPPIRRAGRGPSYDYMLYEDGPRAVAARGAAMAAAASALRSLVEKANEMSLTAWLSHWLRDNEMKIVKTMNDDHHSMFIAQFNFTITDTETREYRALGAYLLGTIPARAEIGKILTADLLYGPQIRETLPNGVLFERVFLVGARRGMLGATGRPNAEAAG